MRLHKIKNYNTAGILSCVGILAVVAVAMLFPSCKDGANAAETQSVNLSATITVKPMIAISVDPEVKMAIDLQQPVMSTTGTANLSVTTNDTSGYQLFMNSVGDPKMTLESESGESGLDSIAPLESAAISGSDAWPANTWGYHIGSAVATGSDQFYGLSSAATMVDNKESVTVTDGKATSYKVTFGVKVDGKLKAGVYSNSVVVSALPHAASIPGSDQWAVEGFAGVMNMQDMTADVCNSANVGDEGQLMDLRDGTLYWVAKLADNRCWMTQNLAYSIPASALTSATSNVTANKTLNKTLRSFNSSSATSTASAIQSWDEAKHWIVNYPYSDTSCGTSTEVKGVEGCEAYFTNVKGMSPTYRASITDSASSTMNGNTYDSHYLVGNFYSWGAATAGITSSSATATTSVCPKGWTLPLGGSTNNAASGSWYNLLNQYGLASSFETDAYNLVNSPIHLIRSGYITPAMGWDQAGAEGYYWSGVTDSSSFSYSLKVRGNSNRPDANNEADRFLGLPVRCVNVQ